MHWPSPNWRDWYHAKHAERSGATGSKFEEYFEAVMRKRFDDYDNPDPAGTFGDGGCDGIKDSGETVYACYGARPMRDAENKLKSKLEADFTRACGLWDYMKSWTFVTNATFGPKAMASFTSLQQRHGVSSERPLKLRRWNQQKLWDEVVSQLESKHLDEVFPGVPGAKNIELDDVLPLIAELAKAAPEAPIPSGSIREVEPTKLDFNSIPADTRIELNVGRQMSPAIGDWFDRHSDPTLEDAIAARFRSIYLSHANVVHHPKEIVERLYVSLGGSDMRFDLQRAEAVYAVTAYFFDSCHIFEEPPPGWSAAGSDNGQS